MTTTRYSVVAGLALVLLVSCGGPPKSAQTKQSKQEPASGESEAAMATETAAAPVSKTRAMYVNVDVANVRKSPSRAAEVLGKVRLGDEVVAVGEPELDWQKIVYGEAGVEAWVHASLLSSSSGDAMSTREAAKASEPTSTSGSTPAMGETAPATSTASPAATTQAPVSSAPAKSAGGIQVGTPADTVLAMRGAAKDERIVGSDANGSIVEWHYDDVVYVMKRWAENGVECYRVAEIR